MATEFFEDTETILSQHIAGFATSEFVEVSDDWVVSDACLQVLTEGLGVVTNRDHFPLGVLNGELALDLAGCEGPLSQYVTHLVPVALCPPQTQMLTIMHTVQELGSVPWFVLIAEQKCVGLVPSIAIFHTLMRYFRRQTEQAHRFWHLLSQGRNPSFESLIEKVPHNPNPGPPSCYCCPDGINDQRPHRLQRIQIKSVDSRGNYLCPYHPTQRVIASIGCTGC